MGFLCKHCAHVFKKYLIFTIETFIFCNEYDNLYLSQVEPMKTYRTENVYDLRITPRSEINIIVSK